VASSSQWEHVAWVRSDADARKRYEVRRRRVDGHLGCGCPSYRFSRVVKTCKHLERMVSAVYVAHGDVERATIRVAEESFTVERRIMFRRSAS
jgi:soluble P-type ATPase